MLGFHQTDTSITENPNDTIELLRKAIMYSLTVATWEYGNTVDFAIYFIPKTLCSDVKKYDLKRLVWYAI